MTARPRVRVPHLGYPASDFLHEDSSPLRYRRPIHMISSLRDVSTLKAPTIKNLSLSHLGYPRMKSRKKLVPLLGYPAIRNSQTVDSFSSYRRATELTSSLGRFLELKAATIKTLFFTSGLPSDQISRNFRVTSRLPGDKNIYRS